MSNKFIGLILAILIVVVAAGAALSFANDTDARYDYSIAFRDSYVDDSGHREYADADSKFALMSITLINDRYSSGIYTTLYAIDWNLPVSNGHTYYPSDIITYPGNVNILYPQDNYRYSEDGIYHCIIVFKVPKTIQLSNIGDISPHYEYGDVTFERDTSLSVYGIPY